MEQTLLEWKDKLVPSWHPISLSPTEIPSSVREAGIYNNLCHVYPSISISGIWHTYRVERIILLRIILCCDQTQRNTPPSHPESPDPSASSSSTISGGDEAPLQHLIDDLCASIPFHLGNRTDPGTISEFNTSTSSSASNLVFPWPQQDRDPWTAIALFSPCERKREALALGGWLLLGPLGVTLQLLAGPVDLWLTDVPAGATMLGSLVRQGQMEWMVQQLQRLLVVQRMLPKGVPIPMAV